MLFFPSASLRGPGKNQGVLAFSLRKGSVGMLFRKIDYTTWTLAKVCCVPNQALSALSEAPRALISVGWEHRLMISRLLHIVFLNILRVPRNS
jgi:hypothetical protein